MTQQADTTEPNPHALGGIRVIELATLLAAGTIGANLADFGAEVIKVEHPAGDPLRRVGAQAQGVSLFWKYVARNKRCVTLDLKQPKAVDSVLRLVAGADVLIENFKPGTMEKWGLGWDVLSEINARLVMVRVSGFGQTGPYASKPAFGTILEALSGFTSINGDADGPPMLPPPGLADTVCGMVGTWATMMALYHRDVHGGTGQMIDLSLFDTMLPLLGQHPLAYDQLGRIPKRSGNRSPTNAPRNAYQAADGGWLVMSTSSDRTAVRALQTVGHPEICDEDWFGTGQGRAEHAELIDGIIGAWVSERALDDALCEFDRQGVPAGPCYDIAQLAADPHVQARESLTEIADPELRKLRMQNVPARLSGTPGSISWAGRPIGADNELLASLPALQERST